jgi:hypothetical protein
LGNAQIWLSTFGLRTRTQGSNLKNVERGVSGTSDPFAVVTRMDEKPVERAKLHLFQILKRVQIPLFFRSIDRADVHWNSPSAISCWNGDLQAPLTEQNFFLW